MAKGARELEISGGAGFGLRTSADDIDHELVLASVRYGWVVTSVVGEDHWFRGNWELLGEVFVGAQYDPEGAYVVGATPLLRYNFAAPKRWRPFVEAGTGPSFTDIGKPDLGGKFQFSTQGGAGVHFLWTERHALTAQFRYIHMSNASLKRPNHGMNACMVLIGKSWFF